MGLSERIQPVLSNPRYTFLLFLLVALAPRIYVWSRIPVDWNSDSYHHWQISYLSLKMGLRQGRLLDLNGCEYYWGMVPHLVQAALQGLLGTASILPYRLLNTLLGGVNAYLVYVIGREGFNWEVGLYAGLLYAFYPFAAVFDVIAMQETLALTLALVSISCFRA
ncbi:MAG: glycosyltransferase family 39 protein, partial [Theionarchaea archaeon]|nr:glycosyltransferase family 39 protein [Theionarchaea archaeon]